MAKTVPPGVVEVPGTGEVVLNAAPDAFDERDLLYRPRLQPLPDTLDRRPPKGDRHVLLQAGQSCVGHAVAAMVNAALPRRVEGRPVRVSPYMLYALARRYDEFPGDADAGSSLRGALRGWYHHGVLAEELWPGLDDDVDLAAPECADDAATRPLGAFYRINPYRLDDVQSALNELDVVVASAAVHEGWLAPRSVRKGGRRLRVITSPVDGRVLGGHAFALVGYNEVGFLVQNSWGTAWGDGGFATLPYDDWLDSTYDAWVARPGVPRTPFARGRAEAPATGGVRALGAAPDLRRLAAHVVNLGNDGELSGSGRFASDEPQLRRLVQHMGEWHDRWRSEAPDEPSRVVLYAHGGLTSEADGLAVAQKHLDWWLNNRVYPITFAWQSGITEVLLDTLVDAVKGRLPAGGLGFDLVEQFDRLVEVVARGRLTWSWDQMKQNALAAAEASEPGRPARGGTRVAELVAEYARDRDGVEVHLVGHSAGSIFHAALLPRLLQAGLAVRSVAFLAPALRVDRFVEGVLPLLRSSPGIDFSCFLLDEQRELDDVVGLRGRNVYQKSLLYLVSRALERGPTGGGAVEVPLLGMAKFLGQPLAPRGTLREAIEAAGVLAVSPSHAAGDRRTDSLTHGGFDDDGPTMTSALLRILRDPTPRPGREYRANSALRAPGPTRGGARRAGAPSSPAASGEAALPAAVAPPGATPLVRHAEAPLTQPEPPEQESEPVLEVAAAPETGVPVLDVLLSEGWEEDPADGRG